MKWLLGLALSLVSFGASATDLQPFVRGSWGELRAAHKARPMIVHFWGLTCGPCLVELPKWGTFVGQAAGVDVVLIAADPVVVEPADLSAKLTKDGLNGVESWRFADSFTERLEFEIDPHWRGELPYTLLIRSDGTVDRILGAVDFAELQRWIERQGGRAESLQTPKNSSKQGLRFARGPVVSARNTRANPTQVTCVTGEPSLMLRQWRADPAFRTRSCI